MVETKKIKRILALFLILAYLTISTPVLAEPYTYPKLTAEAAVLMDAKTGQVLFEKNMNQKKYPASITKIMTGMLALEKGNLHDTLTMSREAVFSIGRNTSHIALDVDEELTLEQALYAIAIESANDASNGIAEHLAGDLESFARLMNKKAAESGALDTNFVNAHGLPDDNHYTTAYDMAKIMMEALKTPGFQKIFSAIRYEMPSTNKQPETRHFYNRNALINGSYQYQGVLASKSGWTSQAKHTLVTAAKQGNRELIVVVMDNESLVNNYEDTITLLDYGFNDFVDVLFNVANLKTASPELSYNHLENVNAKLDKNVVRLLHKSLSIDDLRTSYEFLENDINEAAKIKILINLKQPEKYMYNNLGYITLEVDTEKEDTQLANVDSESAGNYFLPGVGFLSLCTILVLVKRRNNRKRKMFLHRKYY